MIDGLMKNEKTGGYCTNESREDLQNETKVTLIQSMIMCEFMFVLHGHVHYSCLRVANLRSAGLLSPSRSPVC
jgi:hypothetical protein